MAIKYYPLPHPIEMSNPLDGKSNGTKVTHREVVVGSLMQDPRWMQGIKNIRSALEVTNAIKTAEETGVVQLAGEDWELLKSVAENPSYQVQGMGGPQTVQGFAMFTAVGAMQLLPHLDAILGASDKPVERLAPLPSAPAKPGEDASAN